MRNKRKILQINLLILFFSCALTGCDTPSQSLDTESLSTEYGSEIFLNTEEDISLGTEIVSSSELESEDVETETTETAETETEEIDSEANISTPYVPLGYNAQIGLEFVETPARRNRQQALEKIKELSRWYPALYYVYENEEKYPLELILSGAGNPEMADFLYGFLTAEPVANGGFTDEEQPEDFPLFLQYDPRWGYLPYGSGGNVGSSGCGPTCLAMAIFHLTGDRDCTPGAIAQYSLDNGYYLDGIGTKWSLLTNYPKLYGLSSYQISWAEANLKAELDKGHIIICSVRPGDFTSAGHFIVICGYDQNGFKINDPKCVYRSGLYWSYEQIQDDIKAAWTIG